ncbi:hypothetical protein [Tenacibaculum finnmarkense]|uniref:hypothetical protein n=1 Tax=Tenacibaculum finnmarkense TaxID=2781243 RepID=UPI001E53514F|nr:hypothetical protein [Tenacibaculum finnmarkense]MCD8423647.1 hypothetical protein [Tenacibaculum finnmarkense genomovar ulcerans]MCG8239797.1 hypothetical protein [Tenacibaculum finnmarkense genomovar ulcerans]
MKTKLILICCIFLLTSCLPSDEENVQIGFMFEIRNTTGLEYENVKVTIGGIKNGEFVDTGSYTLPLIRIRNNNSEAQYVAVDHNRWRPNLNLVKEISDKAYFTVQLEGQGVISLYNEFENNILVSANITENGFLKNDYGGDLSIAIFEDSIKGLFFEQE